MIINKDNLVNKDKSNDRVRKRLEIHARIDKLKSLSFVIDQGRKKILSLKAESVELERKIENSRMYKAKQAFGYIRTELERSTVNASTNQGSQECEIVQPSHGALGKLHELELQTASVQDKSTKSDLVVSEGHDRVDVITDSDKHSIPGKALLEVRGFNPRVTTSLYPLCRDLDRAVAGKEAVESKKVDILRNGKKLYTDLNAGLFNQMKQNTSLSHRVELRSEEIRALRNDNKLRELENFTLKSLRDEMHLSEKRTLGEKLRILFKAWRMVSCGGLVESASSSRIDPFIKRMLLKQNLTIPNKELHTEEIGLEMWRASVYPPPSPLPRLETPFRRNLRLSHVYGYRGRDCAGNILRLRSGEIAYHVAGLGIIHQPLDKHQSFFQGHGSNSITCIALHPDGLTIATGSCCNTERTKEGIICVWSKVDDTVNSLSTLNGEDIDCVSCICFSKTGRYIFAVGGQWPCAYLQVYEWEKSRFVVASAKVGADHLLAISCNPFTDAVITCGLGSLRIWRFLAAEIERFRYDLGVFRWNLLLCQFELTAGSLSINSFELFFAFIESCLKDGMRFLDIGRVESARAEAKCGIFSCEQLMAVIESCSYTASMGSRNECTNSSHGFDVSAMFARLEMFKSKFQDLVETCFLEVEDISHHQGDFNREMKSIFREFRQKLSGLPVEQQIKLRPDFERIEVDWHALVMTARCSMVSTRCFVRTPMGKTLWKTSKRLLVGANVQALLCIAHCSPTLFVTGAEDGSLLLWDNEELVNVFPLHVGLLTDVAIDCRNTRTKIDRSFYLVTAGIDQTVRLSRCNGFQLIQERCITLPAALVSICNFVGLQKSCGQGFIGRDRNSALGAADETLQLHDSTLNGQADIDSAILLSHIFVVGTVDNSMYVVDFRSENGIQEIVCGQREGPIICLSREPNLGHEFYTVEEDGLVRLWDADRRCSLNSWRVTDACGDEGDQANVVSCAELSQDGSWLFIGLANGLILNFNTQEQEFQRLISKEFEVEVQMQQPSCSVSPRQVSVLCRQNNSDFAEDRKLSNRREELYRIKQRVVKALSLNESAEYSEDDLDNVKRDIDSVESKIIEKAEMSILGLNLIQAELAQINEMRLKIESLQLAHKNQGLDRDEFSHFSECCASLNRLLGRPNIIREVSYDINTGLSHIILERELQGLKHGQKLTIQKQAYRVSTCLGKLAVIRVSPDNIFVVVCGDRGAEIRFFARLHERVCKIKGIEGVVTHLDWAKDSRHIQINTNQNNLYFWKLCKSFGKWACTCIPPKEAADIVWATFSCSMGWAAQGFKSSNTDRSHLIVKANTQQEITAVGDKSASIVIYPYPCLQNHVCVDRIVHRCHSSSIRALAFLDNRLISTSSGDLAILQWSLIMDDVKSATSVTKTMNCPAFIGIDAHKSKEVSQICGAQNCGSDKSISTLEEHGIEFSIVCAALKRDLSTTIPCDIRILQDAFFALMPRQSLFQILQAKYFQGREELRIQVKSNFVPDLLELKGQKINLSNTTVTVEHIVLESDMDGFDYRSNIASDRSEIESSEVRFIEMDKFAIDTPDVNLDLVHIFGCPSKDFVQNVCILRTREIIFSLGRSVIICDSSSNSQRIFCGHDNTVSSLTVHPNMLIIATADSSPSFNILIWDPITLNVLESIENIFSERIVGLDFCCVWDVLAVITGNKLDVQRLSICDWKRKVILIDAPCCSPQVTRFSWNNCISDNNRQQIVSVSGSQVLFWNVAYSMQYPRGIYSGIRRKKPFCTKLVDGKEVWELTSLVGDFVHRENIQEQLCLEFLDSDSVITGTSSGMIFLWKAFRLYKKYKLHSGPVRGISVNHQQCSIASCDASSVKILALDMENVVVVILNLHIMFGDDSNATHLGFVGQRASNTLDHLRMYLTSSSTLLDSKFSILQSEPFFFVLTTKEGRCTVDVSAESSYVLRSINPNICVLFPHSVPDETSSSGLLKCDLQDKCYDSILSVLWTGYSLSFATDSALFSIANLCGCEIVSATRVTFSIEHEEEFSAVCLHPVLPVIITATKGASESALQVWNTHEKVLTHRHQLNTTAFALDVCPAGKYLALGKENGCEIYCANSFDKLKLLHIIVYPKHRKSTVTCLRFSCCSNYLAVGTNFGTDLFDIFGRHKLANWVSSHVKVDLAPAALESELADGVILGYLIESICSEYQILLHKIKLLRLGSFMIETEHPPSLNAWKNRPSSPEERDALLLEVFELVQIISETAHSRLQEELDKRTFPNIASNSDEPRPPIFSSQSHTNSTFFILEQLKVLKSMQGKASDWLLGSITSNTELIFSVLNGLKALEVDNTISTVKKIDLLVQYNKRMSDMESQKGVFAKTLVDLEHKYEDIASQIKAVLSSKTSRSTSSKSQIANLEEKLASVKGRKNNENLNLTSLLSAKCELEKKIEVLEHDIKVFTERSFIMLNSMMCSGSDPVTSIDWSSDSNLLRICTSNGNLATWDALLQGQYQTFKSDTEECQWAMASCIRNIPISRSMAEQGKSRFFLSSTELLGKSALALADQVGRIYVSRNPVDVQHVICCLIMNDAFVQDVGHDRFSAKVVDNLLDPLCDMLKLSRNRFRVARTSPKSVYLQIGAPELTNQDAKCAVQAYAEMLHRINSLKDQPKSLWLKYVVSIQGPICKQNSPHLSKLTDIRYMKQTNQVITAGKSDNMLCMFHVSRNGSSFDARIENARSKAKKAAHAALKALQFGEGGSVLLALENLLVCFASVPREGLKQYKPVVSDLLPHVGDMSIESIKQELIERHISVEGILEKRALVELLQCSRFNPASMKISEIKAELEQNKVSTKGVLERKELIDLLLHMRKDSDDHAEKIATDSSMPSLKPVCPSGCLGSLQFPTKEQVLNLFDLICSIDRKRAYSLSVSAEFGGILAMLGKYRTKLASVCMKRRGAVNKCLYEDVTVLKNPYSIDSLFSVDNKMIPCQNSFLKRGGELYQLAVEAAGGTIQHESIFEFSFSHGRLYQYLRYDKEGCILDSLHEQFHDLSSYLTLQRSGSVTYVPYHKSLQWGLSTKMRQMGRIVESDHVSEQEQKYPHQYKTISDSLCLKHPTSLVYELPNTVPMLNETNCTYSFLESHFHQLDYNSSGSWDAAALKAGLLEQRALQQILGIEHNTGKCQDNMCNLMFCLQGSSFAKGSINLKDWIDFMLPSLDKRSRLLHRFRVKFLASKLRIGVCDISPDLSTDLVAESWASQGHPSWHVDNCGNVYRFGECEFKGSVGFMEGDVITIMLDQDLCLLEFKNETQSSLCGTFCNVYGALVFGVQAEGPGNSVELLL